MLLVVCASLPSRRPITSCPPAVLGRVFAVRFLFVRFVFVRPFLLLRRLLLLLRFLHGVRPWFEIADRSYASLLMNRIQQPRVIRPRWTHLGRLLDRPMNPVVICERYAGAVRDGQRSHVCKMVNLRPDTSKIRPVAR